jgi:hypothetical protein
MEYTVEEVDRVAAALLALPAMEPSKRKLDKQGAVTRLKEQIAALQQRGYTLEQIAESMTTLGLEITTPTLKSYLQRSKKAGKRGANKASRRPASPTVRTQAGTVKATAEKAGSPTASGARATPVDATPKTTRSEFIATDRERL